MTTPFDRRISEPAMDAPRRQSLVRRMYRRVVRSMEIARRRRILNAMPDYLLKDIGINRSDIDSLAEAMVDGRDDPTRAHRTVA